MNATTKAVAPRRRAIPGMAAWAAAARKYEIGKGMTARRVHYLDAWWWTDTHILLRSTDDLDGMPVQEISPSALRSEVWAAPRTRLVEWGTAVQCRFNQFDVRKSLGKPETRAQDRYISLVDESFPGAVWHGTSNPLDFLTVSHNRIHVALIMPLMPRE
jgi:hypothetical protein